MAQTSMDNHNNPKPTWEQLTLERIALANLTEQRRKRRWGIFFKLLLFAYLITLLWLFFPKENIPITTTAGHSALINISGLIMDDGAASADSIIESLESAFRDKHTKGIILRINSSGGTPVQAAIVYNEIRRLQKLYPKIKVYSVCTDICASGGYYVAAASDAIYANPASLVGSIGVLFNGFGFVDSLQKLGVERRLMTAGKNKDFLDPFSPLSKKHQAYAQTMLDIIHQQFIKNVKQGRGNRLIKNDSLLFSGLVWTGQQALPLGLVDGFGDVNYVAREIIKNENVIDFTTKNGYFEQLSQRISAYLLNQLTNFFKLNQSSIR